MTKPRLGILISHPIQYHTPLFRLLARDPRIALHVYFCHDHGVRPSFDAEFGRLVHFDVPLLEGYSHEFLPNIHPQPGILPSRLVNPSIARVLVRRECDVLVVFGYNAFTSMLAFFGPRRSTKIVLRGESNLLRRRTPFILAAKQIYLRALFSRVDHFLSIGRLNTDYYTAYGVKRDRISIAPYSVDSQLFSALAPPDDQERRATRAAHGLPEDGLLVLFVGKFIPLKRPLEIVRAVERLHATPPVSLALVGAGELENDIAAYIDQHELGKRVHRLGFRNQTELPPLYRCADVLVLASDQETWGLVVNEAMAAGVIPVVTDQVGCGPDLVAPSCIYPVGDVDALSAILQRIATDSGFREELRAEAQNRIAKWTLSDTAEAFVQAVLRLQTAEQCA